MTPSLPPYNYPCAGESRKLTLIQGYTLEEMDDVFNSGVPAWRSRKKTSRLEELETEIQRGELKVVSGNSPEHTEVAPENKV